MHPHQDQQNVEHPQKPEWDKTISVSILYDTLLNLTLYSEPHKIEVPFSSLVWWCAFRRLEGFFSGEPSLVFQGEVLRFCSVV